jgi:xylulokinase
MLLMGLDIGTTSVKAAVFDYEGQQQSQAAARTSVTFPAPGQAEQDAEHVWIMLLSVMREAVIGLNEPITALSLSVQGDAVVPVDERGRVLSPFHLGMDYRCQYQAEAYADEFGGFELFRRTGMRPHAMNTLCKIRGFAETMPELHRQSRTYQTYADYLLARLGADEPVIDLTMASRTMGMAIGGTVWDEELLQAAGIKPGQMSKPVASGTISGMLSRSVVYRLGVPTILTEQTLIVTGAHDQVCAAIGAGVISPGLALDSHGTAEVVSRVLDEPCLTQAMYDAGFPCYRFAGANRWFTFSLNHTAGLLLKYFMDTYCTGELIRASESGADPYDLLLDGAANSPSHLIVLPYLNGRGTPVNDLDAAGLIAGITLNTTRTEIARAILESLAFDLRVNLDAAEATGFKTASLRCTGGGACGSLNLHIKADITNREVATLKNSEAACFGAALLAGIGAGAFRSLEDSARLAEVKDVIAPDTARAEYYSERFLLFNRLYEANQNLLKLIRLSALS